MLHICCHAVAVSNYVGLLTRYVTWLQAQEEQILTDSGPEDERLEMIYERLEELDPAKFEVDAAKLLHGLGFGKTMMAKATKDMSGQQHKQIPLLYSQPVCVAALVLFCCPGT